MCICGWLSGIEMLSGAKLNFLSCHPPPLLFSGYPLSHPPFHPLFSSSLSPHPSTPCKECKITFGVFFSTSLSSSSALSVCLSRCLYLVCRSPSPCSDLFSFIRQYSFSTLSQLITAYVCGCESYAHSKGSAFSRNAMSEVPIC